MRKRKRLLIVLASIVLMVVLTGCGTSPITADSTGFGISMSYGIFQEPLRVYLIFSLVVMD